MSILGTVSAGGLVTHLQGILFANVIAVVSIWAICAIFAPKEEEDELPLGAWWGGGGRAG